MIEIWKDIKDFEGYYQVSNLGRVRSLDRYIQNNGVLGDCKIVKIKGKILKPHNMGKDHLTVGLTKNHNSKNYYIHRLVLEAFIPNTYNLPCVNHKDENPFNNELSNLEWCTYKENINHGTCIERRVKKIKKPVLQYDKEMNFIKRWESVTEAQNFLNILSISKCARGERKTAGGYIWKFE